MNTGVQDAKVRDAEALNTETEARDLCTGITVHFLGIKDKLVSLEYGLKFLTFNKRQGRALWQI